MVKNPEDSIAAKLKEKKSKPKQKITPPPPPPPAPTEDDEVASTPPPVVLPTPPPKEKSHTKKSIESKTEKKVKEEPRYTVPGDKLAAIPQQIRSSGSGKDGSEEAFKQAASLMMMFVKDGGRLNSKAKKRKSKRVVRGVGVAKRGYGKATYSKKMY